MAQQFVQQITIVDSAGNPLAGVKVFFDSSALGTTASDGTLSVSFFLDHQSHLLRIANSSGVISSQLLVLNQVSPSFRPVYRLRNRLPRPHSGSGAQPRRARLCGKVAGSRRRAWNGCGARLCPTGVKTRVCAMCNLLP